MAPKLYGWEHLTYLAIFVLVLVGLILISHYFCKSEKAKTILIKSIAGTLLVFILLNRFSIAFVKNNNPSLLVPDTYCGTTSLVLSIWVIVTKPNNKAFHFLWYMGFAGGFITLLYPDFLGQASSFMYLPTISGMLHHSVLLILCILMLQTKWFTPDLKNWYYFPIGMGCYTLYGLFIMDILSYDNAMCINQPILSGTPLNWWFLTLLGTAVITALLLILELIKKRKKSKNTSPRSNESE